MQPQASRVALFGIEIDQVSLTQATEVVSSWLNDEQSQCQFVVTPNVDHVVQLQVNPRMRQAYEAASLVVADGWPLVTAARLLKKPLPERVPGSDLVPQLFANAIPHRQLRTYLLGAGVGVAERAAEHIEQRWPNVSVVGTNSPPLGFENDPQLCDALVQSVDDAQPHLLIVGLGAPKQEIWLQNYQHRLSTRAAVAAGATIDFLAGEQSRAPVWVQQVYLEWLYRIGTDPRRLALRYLRDAWEFPQIVADEWLRLRRRRGDRLREHR